MISHKLQISSEIDILLRSVYLLAASEISPRPSHINMTHTLPVDLQKNQIRVLDLKPEGEDGGITCELKVISLNDAHVRYEALSYVWGDPRRTLPVMLHGSLTPVTENLSAALKHLRFADRARRLWVDALCIDQANNRERAHQVARMGSIYAQASTVIVWLSPAYDGSLLALNFLKRLARNKNEHIDDPNTPAWQSQKWQEALMVFFNLPWWTRTWTVQEFVLAQRISSQCGNCQIEGVVVKQAVHNFFDHQNMDCCMLIGRQNKSLFESLIVMDSLEYMRLFKDSASFIYTASQFRARQATDARDKVYGMLGMATGQNARLVDPDYTRSVEDTFEAAALATIQRTGSFDILTHKPLCAPANFDLPSFVPDWTVPVPDPTNYLNRLQWLGHVHLYRACGNMKSQMQVIGRGKIACKGVEVDRVEHVGRLLHFADGATGQTHDSRATLLQEMRELAKVAADPEGVYCEGQESKYLAFCKTLCGSMERFVDHERGSRPFYRRATDWNDLSKFEQWQAWFPSYSAAGLNSEIAPVQVAFKSVAASRRFVVTKKGLMGFGPPTCRQGDAVVVLFGGRVPYILRLLSQSESSVNTSYSVLGDAYVHGIMDGEALNGLHGDLDEFRLV